MKNNRSKLYFNKANLKVLLISMFFLFVTIFSAFNRELFISILKGDFESIKLLLADNRFDAFLFTLIVMIIQNTLTIIPLILVITLNITLFGFVEGFIWSWITSIIASMLVFISVRYVFQDVLIKKFNHETIDKVAQEGFIYVFQGRIFPFVPTSLVNILAGLSSIRFKHFLLGTLLGNLIYFFVLSLIPAGLITSNVNEYVLGIVLFCICLLFYGLKKIYKRKKDLSFLEPINNDQPKEIKK